MRTIQNLAVPKETDLGKFPDSTIKNEQNGEAGTPVVREIYGDILTNIYKFLRDRKIDFNQLEDNELNGYQFVDALKRNVNELNDIEKILQLDASIFSMDLDLDIIEDKYVVFARSAENYNPANIYSFKGTGEDVYPFTSSGFSTGDELLIVIDFSGVRAYNLSSFSGGGVVSNEIFTPMGNPLAFFGTPERIWYLEEGVLFNSEPQSFNIIESIINKTENSDLILIELMLIQDFLLAIVLDTELNNYRFFKLSTNDFSFIEEFVSDGFDFNNVGSFDYGLHAYFDSAYLYLTNGGNSEADDFLIYKTEIDSVNNRIRLISEINLNPAFKKTSNCVVHSNKFFTLINGELKRFTFDGTPPETVFSFPSFNGIIFKIKNVVYWTNGDVAKIWNII